VCRLCSFIPCFIIDTINTTDCSPIAPGNYHVNVILTAFLSLEGVEMRNSFLMFVGPCIIVITEEQKPTRCHLLFYCTSYRINMFRALLRPSSGARDYNVDYHIGRFVLGLL